MLKRLAVVLVFVIVTFPAKGLAQATQPDSAPKVRTYYVAADEVEWDYAPGGVNKMMGMKFEGNSKVFTERGPHRIGTVYRKALYREYMDATFTKLKPRLEDDTDCIADFGAQNWAENAGVFPLGRTTPRIPTACTPMESSTTRVPRVLCMKTAYQVRTRLTMQSRPGALTPTRGRFRNEPVRGRMTRARSYGSTIRIQTKLKTYRAD